MKIPPNLYSSLRDVTSFSGRASRSEYWWKWAKVIGAVLIYQIAGMIVLTSAFGSEVFREGTIGVDNYPAILFLGCVSIFFVNLVMLPVVFRRFQDCGWNGKWFQIVAFINYAAGLSVGFAIALAVVSDMEAAFNFFGFIPFFLLFLPYASVVWTFWIGFVRPDQETNKYGPNPHEVTP